MTKLNLSVLKKKPVITGAVIIGGGALFYILFLRGGSSQESGGGSSLGYTDMQVAAASEMAVLNQQAMMQGQQIQGQLALAQIAAGSQLAVAETDANLQRDLAAFALQAQQGQIAVELAGIAASQQVEMLGLEKSAEIQTLTVQSQLEGLRVQAERDVYMQAAMANAQIQLGAMSRDVSLAGISAQENIMRHTLDANTQLQLGLGAQSVEKERIGADAAKYSAGKSASAQKSSSKWGAIAGVAMGALALFSDIKLKTIHGCVSTQRCLDAVLNSPIDFWKYLEGEELGDEMHVGVYAQDFYRELGCNDWASRDRIHYADMFGAMNGAIKQLAKLQGLKVAA